MFKRWKSLIVMVLALGLMACQSADMKGDQSELTMITGKAMYRERIALPDTAVLEVKLEDVSLADAPAEVIAEVEIPTNGKQIPIEFSLGYDATKIKDNHRYGLRIKLINEGKLLFINDYHIGVVNDPENTHSVEAMLKGVR